MENKIKKYQNIITDLKSQINKEITEKNFKQSINQSQIEDKNNKILKLEDDNTTLKNIIDEMNKKIMD